MSDLETHYYGDGHDHGDEPAPDAFLPGDYCGTWIKAPRVIGGPSHTHVCRLDPAHPGRHRCHSGDGHVW